MRIERLERAVDDVVSAVSELSTGAGGGDPQQRLRLVAAARRLWVLARDHGGDAGSL